MSIVDHTRGNTDYTQAIIHTFTYGIDVLWVFDSRVIGNQLSDVFVFVRCNVWNIHMKITKTRLSCMSMLVFLSDESERGGNGLCAKVASRAQSFILLANFLNGTWSGGNLCKPKP